MSDAILSKIKYYCAYQERSQHKVRYRLIELGMRGNELEAMISTLIEENYINEERFATAFARGKFRFKQWGKTKIIRELKRQNISAYLIKKAMEEIEEDEYIETIEKLFLKKIKTLSKEKNKFVRMTKVRNYLLQKGYSSADISVQLKKHFK